MRWTKHCPASTLDHVEPTSVLGRLAQLQLAADPVRLRRGARRVERGRPAARLRAATDVPDAEQRAVAIAVVDAPQPPRDARWRLGQPGDSPRLGCSPVRVTTTFVGGGLRRTWIAAGKRRSSRTGETRAFADGARVPVRYTGSGQARPPWTADRSADHERCLRSGTRRPRREIARALPTWIGDDQGQAIGPTINDPCWNDTRLRDELRSV